VYLPAATGVAAAESVAAAACATAAAEGSFTAVADAAQATEHPSLVSSQKS
jgi:hypothetical protein